MHNVDSTGTRFGLKYIAYAYMDQLGQRGFSKQRLFGDWFDVPH